MSDQLFFYPVDRPVERGPSNVTINEHRAPTDGSIRIYDEMKAKAKKAVEKEIMYELAVALGTQAAVVALIPIMQQVRL